LQLAPILRFTLVRTSRTSFSIFFKFLVDFK
jgi:hypothetical protein